MITKIGNKHVRSLGMEKIAIDPVHMGLMAGLAHVGQNVAAHGLMAAKGSRLLPKAFKNALPDVPNAMLQRVLPNGKPVGIKANAVEGVLGGAVPEFKIMGDELEHYSRGFWKALANKGIDPNKLSQRDIIYLRRMLRGDFASAMRDPRGKAMLQSLIESQAPESAHPIISQLLNNPENAEKASAFLNSMSRAWSENSLFGPLGRGMASNMNAKNLGMLTARPSVQRVKDQAANIAGEIGSNIAWGAVDPLVPVINAGKRLAASSVPKRLATAAEARSGLTQKTMQVPKALADKMTQSFVKDPVREAFNRGLKGQGYAPGVLGAAERRGLGSVDAALSGVGGKIDNAFDRYGVNYTANGLKNFSNSLGQAIHATGLATPENIQAVKQVAKTYTPILKNNIGTKL